MSYKRRSPQPVAEGGTGAQTLTGVLTGNGTSAITANTVTQYAVLCGGASNAVTNIASVGTAGQILTSNGAGALPTFQTGAASSISITGDTGGALTGSSFTFTGGTTGLSFGGSGTTETVTGTLVVGNGGTGATTLTGVLTGNGTSAFTANAVTQYNMLVGGASNAVGNIAPSATTGIPLVSQGSSANPSFSTAVVAGGGTGVTTMTTAYAPVCAGTTATGALQVASTGLSTSGYILTSNGAAALPSFQAPAASSISITGNTGGALVGNAFTFSGGTTGLSFGGSGSTETLSGTLIVGNGGTGATTLTGVLTGNGTSAFTASAVTQYNVLVGGASNAVGSVAPSATTGVPLVSQGAAANPAFGTAVVAGGGTGVTSTTAYAVICGGTTSTGALQSVASVGTSGQVLKSNGAGALPSFQNATGGTVATSYTTGGASGTHTLNSSTVAVQVICIGAGGGGGGESSDSAASGGGAGGPGCYTMQWAPVSFFGGAGAGVSYSVGSGGAGGAAVTATNPGNNGTVGGDTIFGGITAKGGNRGIGGTVGSNASGGAAYVNSFNPSYTTGSSGGNGVLSSAGANGGTILAGCAPTGGGGGGNAAGAPGTAGGNGGAIQDGAGNSVLAGGTGGANNGAAGGAGNNGSSTMFTAGTGGGGGAGDGADQNGGNGGAGGAPGGGGGGGGSCLNAFTSGAGGTGGKGSIYIIEYLG